MSAKRSSKLNLTLLVTMIIVLVACKKENKPDDSDKNSIIEDVFVVGRINTGNTGTAALWKNSAVVPLPIYGGTYSVATAVVVSGEDLYTAGYYQAINQKNVAVYWKNGKMNKLSDSTFNYQVTGMVISNNDLYVIGACEIDYNVFQPILWKNGARIPLSTGNYKEAQLTGIVIYNDDVYISGTVNLHALPFQLPVYWKNGQINTLAASDVRAETYDIAVKNNDVYVVGNTDVITSQGSRNNVAVLWKNGTATLLSDINSTAMAVTLNGNDVYVAGSLNKGNYVATYWKNGVVATIKNESVRSNALDILINGNDVYMAGFDEESGAMYWKNGTAVKLSNTKYSTAYSIAIRKH